MSRRRRGRGSVSLGAKLGSGGEGTIYEAPSRPDLAAKVWTKPEEAKIRKLDALLRSKPNIPPQTATRVRLAWPQQPMYDKRKKTIGFAMPRASRSEYREFVTYSIPSARGQLEKELGVSIGERQLLEIARNVAEAFELVHANGCLIGDVNHTNFLVSPDTSVFLIDVDSMQVTDGDTGEVYRCKVGTPDFTPPRLIGKRLSGVDRIPDDDRFGLAALMFQLLMEGNHPYDPVDSASSAGSGNARLENIKRGYSPYTAMLNAHARAWLTASEIPDPALRQRMRQDILVLIEGDSDTDYTALIDRRATAWLGLNPKLQELFRRAFPNDQANDSPSRPTPREWIEALEEVIGEYPIPAFPAPATGPSPTPTAAPRATPHQFGVPLSEPVELWSCDIGYDVWFSTAKGISSPAVMDGAVYVGSPDGSVHVLDAATGDVKWKPPTGGGHIETKPAVVGDTVFVGSTDGSLHALSATTGHYLRKLEFDGALRSSPAAANGTIYFGSSNRYVYALRASTNSIIWAFHTGGAVRSSPAVARGVVYVGSWDNHLYAINAASGDLKWKFKTGGKVESSPKVANGVVYVGSLDNHVYAIDAVSGRELWKYDTGGSVRATPAVSDGVVYVGSLSRRVFALDAANGDLLWKGEISGSARTDLAAEDGVVYVAVANHIYALDAANGEELWKREIGEEEYVYHYTPSFAFSSLTLVDGVLYFTASDGFVRALKVAELRGTIRQQRRLTAINPGELMWRWSDDSRNEFAKKVYQAVVSGMAVYVPSEDGYVYSLDAVTGAVRWRNQIGNAMASSVIVVDGVTYAVSNYYDALSGNTYHVYALDANTGESKWSYKTSGVVKRLMVVDGMVYFESDNVVYALDAATGKQKWKTKFGDSSFVNADVADGLVYFASLDEHVYALNAETGKREWTRGMNGRMATSVDAANGILFVNTYSKKGSRLYALQDATGSKIWHLDGLSTPLDVNVVNGILYASSVVPYRLFALNAATGSVWWSCNVRDNILSIPTTLNGTVYVGGEDGVISAIDALSGKLKWEYYTVGFVQFVSEIDGVVYVWSGPSQLGPPEINGQIVYERPTEGSVYALEVATGDLLWEYETGEHMIDVKVGVPSVVNGVMYFGSEDGCVYALKVEEQSVTAMSGDQTLTPKLVHLGKPGELLWIYATGDGLDSSSAMVDDVVYVGSRDGHMYALNANTGAMIWGYKAGNSIESSPAVVDGVVYVASSDGNVRSLDAATGEVKWKCNVGGWWGFLSSSPAVVDGIVYIGSNDKHLYSLDASSGEVIWKSKTGGMVKSSPTVVNGVVYVGSDDKHLYALYADTGEVRWKRKTDGKVKSSPAVVNGVVYVGSDDKHVYALYANTGEVRWKRKTDGKVRSSPTAVNGGVYVGSDDGNVYAMDSATGEVRWKHETKAEWLESVRSSPAVVDDVLYVGADDSYVYALDAATGVVNWKYKAGDYVRSSPTVVDGVVYVGSNDKCVYALAAGTAPRSHDDSCG